MEKTELKLQQGCAKTKERQMSDDKLMGRRRKRRSRKRRRRRKWELICKKHVQRYRNRQHCPKMNKSGKLSKRHKWGFWSTGVRRKNTHTGHLQLLGKPWGSGGHPMQEQPEPIKASGKGGKNQKSWKNSLAELMVMINLTMRWWGLKKTRRRDDSP